MGFIERVVVDVEFTSDTKGITVMGRLLNIEVVKYKDGPGLVYTMMGPHLGEVLRFKGATRLNQKLHRTDVGKLVSVRYEGEDQSKPLGLGMSYPKKFVVAVDDESIDPATITDDDIPF
jgi:hypothetical protein